MVMNVDKGSSESRIHNEINGISHQHVSNSDKEMIPMNVIHLIPEVE